MFDRPYEVIVIGGGIAGSATAALLSRAGRRVLILEKERFPRDKLCGEFLSTESSALLGELGCLDQVLALDPPKITKTRFSSERGAQMSTTLPGAGLGISRRRLDEILFVHAKNQGAEALEGAEVLEVRPGLESVEVRYSVRGEEARETTARACLAVCAHGRRSKLDRRLMRPFMRERHPYLGLKRHHRPKNGPAGDRLIEELDQVVEIHAVDGGYCGMSFIEGGRVNVCTLLEQRFIDGLPEANWDQVQRALGRRNRDLGARLAALEPIDDQVLAVAEVPFTLKELRDRSLVYIGDAAGMIAPLVGDGQAIALESAILLARLLAPFFDLSPPAIAAITREWEATFRRHFELRLRLSRFLQGLLLSPPTAELALRTLDAIPWLAQKTAQVTRGRTLRSL